MVWSTIAPLAASTRGLFRIEEALEAGVPRSTLYRAIADDGCWRPLAGVAAMPGAPQDQLARLHAVALAGGAPLAFTRWTAAALHGIRAQLPVLVQIVVPNGCWGPEARWIETLRSRTFVAEDIVSVDGLPTVSPARLPLDLAGVTAPSRLRATIIDASQRRLAGVGEVFERALVTGPVPGKPRLLRMCRELDAAWCDSIFEHGVARGLAAAGIRVARQVPVEAAGRRLHLDLAIPEVELGIECEGGIAHSSRRQRHRDGRRGNRLALSGRWRVLTIDWDRYQDDWDGFVAEVREAIALSCAERRVDPRRFMEHHP